MLSQRRPSTCRRRACGPAGDADIKRHFRVRHCYALVVVTCVAPVSHPPITFILGAICAYPHTLPCLQTVVIHPLVCVPCARRHTLNENARSQFANLHTGTSQLSASKLRTVRTFLHAPAISSSIFPLALQGQRSNLAQFRAKHVYVPMFCWQI